MDDIKKDDEYASEPGTQSESSESTSLDDIRTFLFSDSSSNANVRSSSRNVILCRPVAKCHLLPIAEGYPDVSINGNVCSQKSEPFLLDTGRKSAQYKKRRYSLRSQDYKHQHFKSASDTHLTHNLAKRLVPLVQDVSASSSSKQSLPVQKEDMCHSESDKFSRSSSNTNPCSYETPSSTRTVRYAVRKKRPKKDVSTDMQDDENPTNSSSSTAASLPLSTRSSISVVDTTSTQQSTFALKDSRNFHLKEAANIVSNDPTPLTILIRSDMYTWGTDENSDNEYIFCDSIQLSENVDRLPSAKITSLTNSSCSREEDKPVNQLDSEIQSIPVTNASTQTEHNTEDDVSVISLTIKDSEDEEDRSLMVKSSATSYTAVHKSDGHTSPFSVSDALEDIPENRVSFDPVQMGTGDSQLISSGLSSRFGSSMFYPRALSDTVVNIKSRKKSAFQKRVPQTSASTPTEKSIRCGPLPNRWGTSRPRKLPICRNEFRGSAAIRQADVQATDLGDSPRPHPVKSTSCIDGWEAMGSRPGGSRQSHSFQTGDLELHSHPEGANTPHPYNFQSMREGAPGTSFSVSSKNLQEIVEIEDEPQKLPHWYIAQDAQPRKQETDCTCNNRPMTLWELICGCGCCSRQTPQ